MAFIICLVIAAGAILIFMATDNEPEAVPSPETNQSQPASKEETTTDGEPKSYPISVYFSKHPESDNDPGKTFPVSRISPDLGVARFAIAELLKGPTADESQKGYFSYVRLVGGGTTQFKLTITNGVATLQFLKPFDHVGSVSDGQAESAIIATLKQFDSIKKIVILNSSGNCEFDLSGLNLCKQ